MKNEILIYLIQMVAADEKAKYIPHLLKSLIDMFLNYVPDKDL